FRRHVSLSARSLRLEAMGSADGISVYLAVPYQRAAGDRVGPDRHRPVRPLAAPEVCGPERDMELGVAFRRMAGEAAADQVRSRAGVGARDWRLDPVSALSPDHELGEADRDLLAGRAGRDRLDSRRRLVAL